MWVFIDDSGCGGFKFGSGSTSHLVIASCVFTDPLEIERLAQCVERCRERSGHRTEYRYSKTKRKVQDCFFDCTDQASYVIRAIMIDKSKIYSPKLRSDPKALKSFAIRMLLTKNFGQIRNAKIIIDGQDTQAFGITDSDYLTRMVERYEPGTIAAVKFGDSKANVGIQLADMVAGAINRGVRTHKPSDDGHLSIIRPRTYQPRGTLWNFTR